MHTEVRVTSTPVAGPRALRTASTAGTRIHCCDIIILQNDHIHDNIRTRMTDLRV